MTFNLLRQQVQYQFVEISGILANMEKLVIVRLKTRDEHPVLKHSEFTFGIIVMYVFSHLEMMNFLVHTYCDRVIFHRYTTISKPVCLGHMEQVEEMHSFPYSERFGGIEHNYRITENGNKYVIEQDGLIIAEVSHEDTWLQVSGEPMNTALLESIRQHIEAHYD
jgi:hypothetical protein